MYCIAIENVNPIYIVYIVGTDRQEEITKLQEVISSLTLQLTAKDKIITQLTSKDADEEDSQQEEDEELPRKL